MTRSGVVPLLTAFLFVAAATPLSATTYTSSQSGNWSSSSTWGGVGVPGAGDTASVGNVVTLDVPVTVATLTLTGTLLMFYYHPSTDLAYTDIKDLETVVVFGQILRNMHRWAAHGMVITVFLHMIRVFYTGSYKPPREFNWVVGTLLFVLTLLLSYTGYLLPWDQLAFWAVTVGYNIAQATPFVGNEVSFVLFGGYQLGANALLRFYVLHVVALPLTAGFLIAIHFWRIRKDGGISGPL